MTPERLARLFHETYERKAPLFGWETHKESRVFDPDSPNGRLMIEVCREVLRHLALDELVRLSEEMGLYGCEHDWVPASGAERLCVLCGTRGPV